MSDPVLNQTDNPYALLVRTPYLGTDIRLHVYEPDGVTTRGIISNALEIEVYDRAGQTPTLTVKVTNHVSSTRYLLQGPCIVAVETMVKYTDDLDHFVYDELRNMRFVVLDVSHDRSLAGDPTDTYTVKGVGMFNLFEGSRVLLDPVAPTPEAPVEDDKKPSAKAEKRVFAEKTPGEIVWTLFNEAKNRGELLPVQLGFNLDTDTFGNSWPVVSREYSPSTSLRTVISNMLESGLAEFWMHRGTLYMAKIGEWDRVFFQTVGSKPYIRDLTPDSAPETVAYNELISRVLLIGDEGYTREGSVEPDPNLMPFGGRTLVIEAGGVSTDEDADRMINQALIEGGGATRTYTRDWTYAGDQTPMGYLPFRDFNPGDWVLADVDGEPRAKMQVRDMSLKRANGVLKASVTLGSLRDDLLTRLARQAQALSDGAAVASTGRPKPVAGGGEYDAHPGKYTGLKVTDKAGGLKAYRPPIREGDGYTNEYNTSLSVDKDTGDVALKGRVDTEKTTFTSSSVAEMWGTSTERASLEGTAGGMWVHATRQVPTGDHVEMNTITNNDMSVVGTYSGKAVLGAASTSAIDTGTPENVVGVVAELPTNTPGNDKSTLYLQGDNVNVISDKTTVRGVLSAGSVRTPALTVENDNDGQTHIHGFTRLHGDVDVDGLLSSKVNVITPNSYVKGPLYAVYVDKNGTLYKAKTSTPVSTVRK